MQWGDENLMHAYNGIWRVLFKKPEVQKHLERPGTKFYEAVGDAAFTLCARDDQLKPKIDELRKSRAPQADETLGRIIIGAHKLLGPPANE